MIRARYFIAPAVFGIGLYTYLRTPDGNGVSQIDLNVHVCSTIKPYEVKKALADQGFTVSEDERVKDANVLEVPENQKDAVISSLQLFQEQHPDWDIRVRTDKYNPPKE
jgi:hypothetical protein